MRAGELRAETALLVDCLASALGPRRNDPAPPSIPRRVDWNRFQQLAWNHAVTPLVLRQLRAGNLAGSDVPPVVLEQLRSTAAAIAGVNLRLTAELIAVSAALTSAGVPVISYKGPALAWRAYGDLSLRHFNDLDVLVREEDVDRAVSVLHGVGYLLRESSSQARAARQWGHHFSLVRDDPQSLLELHWRFHKPMFGPPVLEERAWRNATWDNVAGHSLPTLSTEDELLVIATHGSWHGWSQLSWICDVAALTSARADWSADELLEKARSSGIVRPLLLAFELVRLILARPLPARLAAETKGIQQIEKSARWVLARIDSGRGVDAGSGRLQLAVRDRIGDKIRFALRALFIPNPSDVAALRLSGPLFPIYYLLRPARIAFKYRPRQLR